MPLRTHLLNYGDCDDRAKMTGSKMAFLSRHYAPPLRVQLQSSRRGSDGRVADTRVNLVHRNGLRLLTAM